MMGLTKHAQRVQDALDKYEYGLKVLELEGSTRTAVEASKTLNCELGQIVKSLIFKANGEPLLFLVSGNNRLNTEKIEQVLSIKIERANPAYVKTVIGFSIGGVPPLAHIQNIETYIDADLLNHEIIWSAAGMPNTMFRSTPEQLIEMTTAKLIDVK